MVPLLRSKGTSEAGHDLSINKDDIMRFLDLVHVQKLDVSICYFTLLDFFSTFYISITTFCSIF